jgi:hypothetical protein
MAAPTQIGAVGDVSNGLQIIGIAGTGAAAVCIQTGDMSRYDTFMLMSTAGSFEVLGCIDDVNYSDPLTMQDLGDAAATYVIASVAGHMCQLKGQYRYLQVQQVGATDVANLVMLCSRQGAPT